MIYHTDGVVRRGRVIHLTADIEPGAVAAAIRGEEREGSDVVDISCPDPSPLHDFVGYIHPEMGLRTRTALAEAARTRGATTPYDDDIQAVREELEAIAVEDISLESHRQRIADAETAVEQARVRAAEARGRVRQQQESGGETGSARAQLDDALKELSETETAAIAARQAYSEARENRREQRDRRERRLRLEDRIANLERQARSHLVDQVREEFTSALSTVPGTTFGEKELDELDTDPVSAALAIARLGTLVAPVVLATDRFESPESASEWLDAPVVHL